MGDPIEKLPTDKIPLTGVEKDAFSLLYPHFDEKTVETFETKPLNSLKSLKQSTPQSSSTKDFRVDIKDIKVVKGVKVVNDEEEQDDEEEEEEEEEMEDNNRQRQFSFHPSSSPPHSQSLSPTTYPSFQHEKSSEVNPPRTSNFRKELLSWFLIVGAFALLSNDSFFKANVKKFLPALDKSETLYWFVTIGVFTVWVFFVLNMDEFAFVKSSSPRTF
jgi:hypothetical protein